MKLYQTKLRSFGLKKCRACLLVNLLLCCQIAIADPGPSSRWEGNFPESGYLTRRLGFVLEGLRQTSRSDAELAEILNKIRLRAPNESLYHGFPNAWAISEEFGKYILIESRFVDQVAMFSVAAAYLSLADLDGINLGARSTICGQLVEIHQEARRTGSVPVFSVQLEKLPEFADPPTRRSLEKLSGMIMDQVAVWILLHEIGHHVRGHRATYSKAESRTQEREADYWASNKMHGLGFSLFGVERFLEARAFFNSCLTTLGYDVGEDNSTHPSWRERTDNLKKGFNVISAGGGYPKMFYIPAHPFDLFVHVAAPGYEAHSSVSQNYQHIRAVTEWQGNGVIAYARANDGGRIEIRIPDTNRMVSWVTHQKYDSNNNRSGPRLKMGCIQFDLRILDWMEIVPGTTFGELRQEKNKILVRQIHQAGGDFSAVLSIISAKQDFDRAERQILSRYMKGELHFHELPSLISPVIDQLNRQLEAALGKEGALLLREIQASDPVMAWKAGQEPSVYRKLEENLLDYNVQD